MSISQDGEEEVNDEKPLHLLIVFSSCSFPVSPMSAVEN